MKTKKVSTHLNNKGFSLLELIVAIAIMAVLVGVAVASTSLMDSSYAKEVERGVEDYVNMAKSKSMSVSAREWYMELTVEDDEYVTKLCKTEDIAVGEGTETRTVVLDEASYNSRVTVTYDDGVSVREIDDTAPLCIYFDAATGRVNKITVGGLEVNTSNGIGRIAITSGNYDLVMKLFYNTGKCERE